MRTIGLLGGLSWHSSAVYYDRINRGVAARLGPHRSARLVMHSIDYGEVLRARQDGDWARLGGVLVSACKGLQRAGADGLFLCSNTIHRFAPRIQSQLNIPVIHIADALAERIIADGHTRVGLLGTAFTLTTPFYAERLRARGLDVLLPPPEGIAAIDRVIVHELTAGVFAPSSRERFIAEMRALKARGAQVIALGCTEIGLLVHPGDLDLPVLDTALVHADAAVAWSLDDTRSA